MMNTGDLVDGIIMNQFQRFVVSRFGREAWPALTRASGVNLGDDVLSLSASYPDSDLIAMVPAASEMTGIPVPELLELFGIFIAPALLRIYEPLIIKTWRTLDVIENTEASIHRVVRQRNPSAAPPELRVDRVSSEAVEVDYRSRRRLCHVAVGIIKGIAANFGETVSVTQSECMLRSDARCLITVRRTAVSS